MSNSDPTAADIARLRDASKWVQRLHEPNAGELAEQWTHWCGSDPLNLPAFEQMRRTWDAFSAVKDTSYPAKQPANRLKHRGWYIALAASVVLAVGTAGWLALRFIPEVQVLDTRIGEQRRVTLSDGSHVDLAPDSRVTTRFTLARRDVRLASGQAFFEVAHDAARPFIVHASGLTVTAVGTAFDVRIGPSGAVVMVSEGRVNVAPVADEAGGGASTSAGTVRASVGQRVTFSNSTHRLNAATVDPGAAGSWRDGTLQFVGEPLQDVVGAVNRYGAPTIAVTPAFQQTRFTGTVSPARTGDWLKALEQIYAVKVVDRGANGILIRSRANDGAQ